jgi:hypothetical protein
MKISGLLVQERAARRVSAARPNLGCGPLVLGAWLTMFSALAQASPLRGLESDLTVISGQQPQYTFIDVDRDNWDFSALQSLDALFATAIDPVELGAGAVVETLKQDPHLRQVVAATTALGTLEAVSESQAVETASVSLQNAELGSPAGQSGLSGQPGLYGPPVTRPDWAGNSKRPDATAPITQRTVEPIDVDEAALTDQPDTSGLSLKEALRSVVTKKRSYQGATATAIAETAGDISETTSDDDFIDLGDRVLDSRTLGEALAALVQPVVTAQGSQAFAILGEGQFELDTSSGVQDMGISEASTGLSVSVPLRAGLQPPPPKPQQRMDLVVIAANFLATPTGTLASISFGILILVWAMAKVALAIRR